MPVLSSPDSPSVSELGHLADDHSRLLPLPAVSWSPRRGSREKRSRDRRSRHYTVMRKANALIAFVNNSYHGTCNTHERPPSCAPNILTMEAHNSAQNHFVAIAGRHLSARREYAPPGAQAVAKLAKKIPFVWSLPSSEHTARDTAGPSHRRAVHLPFRAPCWKPCRPPIRSTTAPKATW